MRFSIPVSLPYGLVNPEQVFEFEVELNLLRRLVKHMGKKARLKVSITNGHPPLITDISYGGLILRADMQMMFRNLHAPEQGRWTLNIETDEDFRQIGAEYTSPDDIERDLVCSIGVLLQGALSIYGHVRVTGLIHLENGQVLLNTRLTHLLNPGQDWFGDRTHLGIIFDKLIFNTAASRARHYLLLHPYLSATAHPLDWKEVCDGGGSLSTKDVYSFGKVLSEIIRQHPSIDFSPMVGLLTAFIEGLLKISGENRFKFSIKIANLFQDRALAPIAKRIYDLRSDFFHSARSQPLNDICEIAELEFLVLSIRKILLTEFRSPIAHDTFDFPAAQDQVRDRV